VPSVFSQCRDEDEMIVMDDGSEGDTEEQGLTPKRVQLKMEIFGY
jgi:hypothetical protein